MFFFLSKTVGFLITPLAWILIAVTFAFMTNKTGRRKKRNLIAFILLIIFTNPWMADRALKTWEMQPQSIGDQSYDVAIILSGMTKPELNYGDQVQFSYPAERFIEAIKLYQQSKVKKLLFTGGSGQLTLQELKETPALKQLAIQLSVAEKDILIESASRNTFENAKFTAELLKEHFDNPSILLITSASHMKRAAACFEKQGIEATLYPVDFNTNPSKVPFLKDTVPDHDALLVWTMFFHEVFGFVSYWVVGYL